ncbi:MAG: hypothetical protein ACOCP8_01055 [archaeon]
MNKKGCFMEDTWKFYMFIILFILLISILYSVGKVEYQLEQEAETFCLEKEQKLESYDTYVSFPIPKKEKSYLTKITCVGESNTHIFTKETKKEEPQQQITKYNINNCVFNTEKQEVWCEK